MVFVHLVKIMLHFFNMIKLLKIETNTNTFYSFCLHTFYKYVIIFLEFFCNIFNFFFGIFVCIYIYIKYIYILKYIEIGRDINIIKTNLLEFFDVEQSDKRQFLIFLEQKCSNFAGADLLKNLYFTLLQLLPSVLFILCLLIIIAYSTLVERKILASMQWRRGPNKVGLKGSMQPIIDGIKLILKETLIPIQSEKQIFILAARWSFVCMILLWLILPLSPDGSILEVSNTMLLLFCISVLSSISLLLAGWASNSKYSFLGGVRAGAQLISYDLVFGLLMLIVMFVVSSTQIEDVVNFQQRYGSLIFFLPVETLIFLIIIVAETNWAPFDFAEAESELVSGYNTEYSGLPFSLFFIAEYGNILYMSFLTTILFLGGWSVPTFLLTTSYRFFCGTFLLVIKSLAVYIFFLWLRGTFPRFWYDQLMFLCWKIFLPLCLSLLLFWITLFVYYSHNLF